VERVIQESGLNGCVPDVVTYISYIAGLCRYVKDAFPAAGDHASKGELAVVALHILLDHAAHDLDMWVGKDVLERCEELSFEVDRML
jgi:hypothetical protein